MMSYSWHSCPVSMKTFVQHLNDGMRKILGSNLAGIYLHGSLSMGGFHPDKSDIDLVAVVIRPISKMDKKRLMLFFLKHSKDPYPVEISILGIQQLEYWKHPSTFEFHYSEAWRGAFEKEGYLIHPEMKDPDLAAHVTTIRQRGMVISGRPILDIFPSLPRPDYLDSILGDIRDCQAGIEKEPVYCILNMIRCYIFLETGKIVSKHEAGKWKIYGFPPEFQLTVQKAAAEYEKPYPAIGFTKTELLRFKNYMRKLIESCIN